MVTFPFLWAWFHQIKHQFLHGSYRYHLIVYLLDHDHHLTSYRPLLRYLTPEDQEMSESEKQKPVEKCLKLKCSQVQQHLMQWVLSDQHPKITQRLQ